LTEYLNYVTWTIEVTNENKLISRKENIFLMEKNIFWQKGGKQVFNVRSNLNDTGDAIRLTVRSKMLWVCELHIYGTSRKHNLLLVNKAKMDFTDIFLILR
jgi:hypothetical protein